VRLHNRRILITGAASGIGRATAELFVAAGARVGLLDFNRTQLDSVCSATGGLPLFADVRDETQVQQAVAEMATELGGIDGLVNSAGIADGTLLEKTTLAQWRDVLETNLTGTFLVCREAMPWLRKAAQATIVNLASGQALLPTGNSAAYSASKGGVLAMSKDLACQVAPSIRVNVICPGTTDTPMVRALMAPETHHIIDRLVAAVPLQRLAEAREIASAILFLTSHDSSFMTGTAIAVDGGRTRH
jgi:NAD(P)-dependent dehydrogenase (short-subunit alcohol dehydrogenase family)